jgi:hypothetical protein
MPHTSMQSQQAGQVRVQVHPDKVPSLDTALLKAESEAVAKSTHGILGFRSEEGEDQGRYLNLVFGSYSPLTVWPAIRAALYESPRFGAELKSASMALCTGEDGWNDYRLLYHFDPSVPLDAHTEA